MVPPGGVAVRKSTRTSVTTANGATLSRTKSGAYTRGSSTVGTGAVKRELDKAYQRAGRVWNIVRIMTPNAAVLRSSMDLYLAPMYAESPLSRAQREMLAVVVSRANHCKKLNAGPRP